MKLTVRGNCPAGSRLRSRRQASSSPPTTPSADSSTISVSGRKLRVLGPIGPEASISVPVSAMPATA